jgi:LemA protein
MIKINAKSILIALAVIAVLVMTIVAINIGTSNHAIALEENANNSLANVQAQEKRRVDLVFNLVDSVKSYADYERKTQLDIIAQRTQNGTIDANGGATINIKAVAEAYPDLKASEQYKQLMIELTITENQIFNYRTIYNDAVRDYLSFVRKWPASWILKHVADFKYLEFEAPSTAPQHLFDGK